MTPMTNHPPSSHSRSPAMTSRSPMSASALPTLGGGGFLRAVSLLVLVVLSPRAFRQVAVRLLLLLSVVDRRVFGRLLRVHELFVGDRLGVGVAGHRLAFGRELLFGRRLVRQVLGALRRLLALLVGLVDLVGGVLVLALHLSPSNRSCSRGCRSARTCCTGRARPCRCACRCG